MFIAIGIDKGQSRIPWMALAVGLLNIAIFALTANRPDFTNLKIAWGYIPDNGCLATLITHMFMHENVWHLLFNLIFFVLPAMKLEDAIGSWRFLGLYLTGGIAANACHVLLAGTLPVPMIGASGAISAIVGAFMVLYPASRLKFWILPPFPIFIRLPAWVFFGYFFFHELATGYLLRVTELDSPVAVWAHAGGFAFGALTIWAFYGWNQGNALEGTAAPAEKKDQEPFCGETATES